MEATKGQQLAGHFPTDEDFVLGRRILLREITLDEAIALIVDEFRN